MSVDLRLQTIINQLRLKINNTIRSNMLLSTGYVEVNNKKKKEKLKWSAVDFSKPKLNMNTSRRKKIQHRMK